MVNQLELRIFPDTGSLYLAAADLVTVSLGTTLEIRESATFVLNGGSTPRPLLEFLAAPPFREKVDWSRMHFFWGDERCVGPESPQSNYRMAWKALLSKIQVPGDHIHRIHGEMTDNLRAAAEYEEEIRRVEADVAALHFDLVLLGMGEEGHTASLFPETQWDEDRLVVAIYVPKLKAYRISMTPRLLNTAAMVVFMVTGSQKAEALVEVLAHGKSGLPAGKIRPTEGRLIWLVDEEAASLLPRKHNRQDNRIVI